MNATPDNQTDLAETLRRCSPETLAAAKRFRENGDTQAVPQIVFGILERYQPAGAPVKLSDASGDMRLIEDIGLDSLTLLEIVMTIEEVLRVRIENDELRELRTLGRLNQFIAAKINGTPIPPASRHYNREQIMLALPQQPPFLFLDSAELDATAARADYTVKGDEFFLAGHFRDEPIFPASIVFEALGQAACLWVLEKGPAQLGHALDSKQVFFASLDGAQFFRKTRPGEKLRFELQLTKLRAPLAVFAGTVTSAGERVARIEKLVLAFGEQLLPETNLADAAAPASHPAPASLLDFATSGHH